MKKEKIFQFLLNERDYLTAEAIAKQLSISARSVRYNISLINEEYNNIIISSPKGYKLINRNITSLSIKSDIPSNYIERKRYILRLLVQNTHPINYIKLANALCISETTLSNEISRIRFEISPLKLKIQLRNGELSLIGDKKDIQSCFMNLVNEEINNSSFSSTDIQSFFKKVNIQQVKDVIMDCLTDKNYYIDENSLNISTLSIATYIELYTDSNSLFQSDLIEIAQDPVIHVQDVVGTIFERLAQIYDFKYTTTTIFDYALVLMTRIIREDIDNVTIEDLEKHIDNDTRMLLYSIIENVNKNFSVDLYNKNFIVRFSFHLRNLIIRLAHQRSIPNSTYEQIKNTYPLMYSIALYISHMITSKTGYEINEEEISYIALHVGVAIEENNKSIDRLKTIIYSPNYYLIGEKLYDQLSKYFSDYLVITQFITTINGLNMIRDTDLILTTVNLNSIKIPTIKISPFMTSSEIKYVTDEISQVKKYYHLQEIRTTLKIFFKPDLFFINKNINDDQKAIEFLCKNMYEKGYTNIGYIDKIREREAISKSAFGPIAIPHPLDNDSEVSSVSVLINKDGIDWGGRLVKAVFMLSIASTDVEMFSEVFKTISEFCANDSDFEKLINIKSYKEFIDLLLLFE